MSAGSLRRLLTRWRTGAAALRQQLAAADPHQRVDWVAGQLSIRTLATTRLSECWIHTGDVAGALGVSEEPSDRLEHIARLAWRTLPYAFARDGRGLAGPVAFDLRAPSGTRWHFVPEEEPATVIEGSGTSCASWPPDGGRQTRPRCTAAGRTSTRSSNWSGRTYVT